MTKPKQSCCAGSYSVTYHVHELSGVKNFTWWQPEKKTALVIFTNGDHGASAYRVLLRKLLNADPLSPEWV